MKIAYLARRPIPSRNAHAVQIVKMCAAFAGVGHQVDLFAYPGEDGTDLFGRYGVPRSFDVHYLPRNWGAFAKWRHVAGLLRSRRLRESDLLFGRDILSLSACARLGIPLVYEAHLIPAPGSPGARKLGYLFGRPNFSHLVCVTSTLAERYRRQFPALGSKPILVEPNAAAEPGKGAPVENWPGRPGAVQVGFVGRPFPGKGIEMLAAAAERLPGIDFHVVGAHASEAEWLTTDLPANLRFHGYRPHGELPGIYRRLDIAVAPYGAEVMNASGVESAAITSPLKLLEYWAASLPTIVSDLPGVRNVVQDAAVTIIVPPGDAAAFIAALQQLAADAPLRAEMATAARERYLSHHTVESRARRVLAPLEQS